MNSSGDSRRLETIVRQRIDRWEAGESPDAPAVLANHPELRNSKSMVLELAQSEYLIRAAGGESISKSQFCERFPVYRQSIARMVEVEQYAFDKRPPDGIDDGKVRWPAPGDEFLGFEIIEPLGLGALARVFLAREPAVGDRQVVIKISPGLTREAHALGKLSHPSIVQILHTVCDETEGWTVICMPLVGLATAYDLLDAAFQKGSRPDGSFVARIARETLPLTRLSPRDHESESLAWNLTYPEAIARLGLQLAEGLAAAHEMGILHRDIKPSNILLAWSGRAMLLDFNLSADTGAGSLGPAGTLAYMAPEVIERLIREQPDAFDPRSDIYSLGAVLYELLTGRLVAKPEDAENLSLDTYEPWLECKRRKLQIAEMVGTARPTDQRLAGIVLKCLEYDPASRYQNAAELASELRSYLSGPARVLRTIKRRRRAVVLGGLGMIAASVGLGSYVASRPTELERAYREGLEQYEREEYEAAVASFTKCLELNSGWPHAHFARAQALRKLQKWREARADFAALRGHDPAWSYAFAGFCSMQLQEDRDAAADYLAAYQRGLKDKTFLLNYARTQSRVFWDLDAAKLYGEVLKREPTNCLALRNRALAFVSAVLNNQKLPNEQAFADVEEYCRLEPSALEPPYYAAVVYGEAARKDARYEERAVHYLTEAFRRGVPPERISNFKPQLKRLVALVDANALINAEPDNGFRTRFTPIHEFPQTADWESFELEFGTSQPLLASVN